MTTRKPPRSVQRMKQLCVSLEPDTMTEIDVIAKAAGLGRSEWVRVTIWDRMYGVHLADADTRSLSRVPGGQMNKAPPSTRKTGPIKRSR